MYGNVLRALGFIIGSAFLLSSARAENQPAREVALSVTELAQKLGDGDFAVREAAARSLESAGALAVPALVDAATKDGDAEARLRARSILNRLGSASDEATVAALNKIVESGPADSAEIARSVLKLVTDGRSGEIPVDEFSIPGIEIEEVGGGIRFKMAGGGTIQIGRGGGGGFNRSSLKTGGGVSLIVGSSDNTQVVIAILPTGGIKMKVATDEEGGRATRAFQYRNGEEFEAKNPELFELFERFRDGRRK